MQRGAGFRGDHPHAVGRGGKRFFILLIEQPFRGQRGFQLLILLLQKPFTRWLHALNDNLIITARLVQGDTGAYQHLLPVLRSEGHPAVAVAEHRAAHLGGIVLQGKVPVTGCRLGEIRDLSADPHLAYFLLKQQTDRLVKAADSIN